jgi:hypothetical protein
VGRNGERHAAVAGEQGDRGRGIGREKEKYTLLWREKRRQAQRQQGRRQTQRQWGRRQTQRQWEGNGEIQVRLAGEEEADAETLGRRQTQSQWGRRQTQRRWGRRQTQRQRGRRQTQRQWGRTQTQRQWGRRQTQRQCGSDGISNWRGEYGEKHSTLARASNLHVLVVDVGGGGRLGQHVGGVEDVEALVFHCPHVEV